jgi:hypothetical protein
MFWLVWKNCFDLVRSTKNEAPLIDLWPKFFSVTVTRRLGLKDFGFRLKYLRFSGKETGKEFRVCILVFRACCAGFGV